MIIFSSVSKSFAGDTAIKDLSLEIKDGELVLITGPSGAGKTTLMKLLIREYLPTSGEITVDEWQLSTLKGSQVAKLRQQIGVIFQDYKLIPEMNVWENVALPLYITGQSEEEIESRVTDLLNLVELADKALYFPKQLSGGEAQRIGIARALATGPRVIFADEPTGNLDSHTTRHIIRLLQKINQLGTTLLLATHNEEIIKDLSANQIVKLSKESDKQADVEVKNEYHATTETKEIDQERTAVKAKQAKLEKELASKELDKKEEKELAAEDKTETKEAAKTEQKPAKQQLPWQKLKLTLGKKSKAKSDKAKEAKDSESKEEKVSQPSKSSKEKSHENS